MVHYLVTSLVDFFVGILALSKRGNLAARALALMAFSLGLWSLELFLLTEIKDATVLAPWFHLTRWGMFFIPPSLALLTWRLIGSRSRLYAYVNVIPSFVVAIVLSIGNALFFPSTLVPAVGGYLPKPDFIFYAFAFSFLWCLINAIVLGAARYKIATYREKQRVKWLLIILSMILLAGVASIYLVKYSFYLKFVGAVTNIVCISLLFYATVQNNLMDVRSAIGVTMARGSVLAAIVWFYFYIIGAVGDRADSIGGAAITILFVIAVLELYPRLLKLILPNAKKILVKNGYEFDLVKEDTEKALNQTMSMPMMFEVLDHLLLKIVRVENYSILLVQHETTDSAVQDLEFTNKQKISYIADDDPLLTYSLRYSELNMVDEMPEQLQQSMATYNAVSCYPVLFNGSAIALVLIGSSGHMSYYRYDDIRLFEWLAKELGQVLQRLVRLERMHDQLGEAKKTLSMLGMMSHYHHDIKAPFAIIDGVVSNDFYDRDKQKHIVLEQVERGSRLIATMASILGGNRKRRVQPCQLEKLVKDCLFVFEMSIDKVEYQLSGIPLVAGDSEDLKILFINIIKNAIEARRGYDDLILTVRSSVTPEGVFFSIKDNGVGMTPMQLGNIWDQNGSSKELGSGIGMQAIKRIADEHGATVNVKSEIGVGTEFIVQFPIKLVVTETAPADEKDELAARRATLK